MENRPSEEELMAREEKCRKAMKTLARAILMRLFAMGLLVWALTRTEPSVWILGLMAFVLIITLSGMLPLVSEMKKRRRELKEILNQYA